MPNAQGRSLAIGLRDQFLAGIDESVHLEPVLLVVKLLVAAIEREKLCGCVGLELYDADALLRSVAVAKGARTRGLGRALVDIAERDATALGVSHLFLLTTSAAHYFAMLGYQPFARNAAPSSLRSSSQFSALCPTSAVCMMKDLTQQEA